MDWTDVRITVAVKDLEPAEAMAQLAAPGGIYVEDYSDLLEEVPRIAHIDLIDEELLRRSREEAVIHLYIPPDRSPAEAVAYLAAQLEREGIPHRVETAPVREEEWSTAWKKYYHPTPLGKRLVVCPTWEEYSPAPGELVMRLDPGMAFGTGTHHTTRLCAQLLEETVAPGCRVLDLGTGSGILSIAAVLLGAREAVGVDIDPVAVRTARENAAMNGIGPDRFRPLQGDLLRDPALAAEMGEGFDLIAANIVADAIIAVCPSFLRFLRPGGMVITSGIISERVGEVTAALAAQGLELVETKESEGWAAVIARRPL